MFNDPKHKDDIPEPWVKLPGPHLRYRAWELVPEGTRHKLRDGLLDALSVVPVEIEDVLVVGAHAIGAATDISDLDVALVAKNDSDQTKLYEYLVSSEAAVRCEDVRRAFMAKLYALQQQLEVFIDINTRNRDSKAYVPCYSLLTETLYNRQPGQYFDYRLKWENGRWVEREKVWRK